MGFLVAGVAPVESGYLLHRGLAGMVYSVGLRRCLIIFAPQTLVLDRRTQACRTPSLQLIRQRSKNFTSGVAVSVTPKGPLVSGRCMPPPTGPLGDPHREAPRGTSRGTTHQVPHCNGLQGPAQLSQATFGRCFDIPWIGIQPRLVALSTLSFPRCLRWWAPVV